MPFVTQETAKRVERRASDKADSERSNSDAPSRWTDEDGAPAPTENAPEDTADATWFVPPIVIPALLLLFIAVRILAVAYG